MLHCEHLMLEGFIVNEIGYAASAGIGAAAGAGGTAAVWAAKRLKLNKKMKECKDDACKEKVKTAIKELRTKALKYGASAAVGGAGVGIIAKSSGDTRSAYKSLSKKGITQAQKTKHGKALIGASSKAYGGLAAATMGGVMGTRTLLCGRWKKQLKTLTDEKLNCKDDSCRETIQNKLDVLKRQLSKTNCNFTK